MMFFYIENAYFATGSWQRTLQLLDQEGSGVAMGLCMPKKERIVVTPANDTMTKELISMYDKRNITDFDKIDVKGLAPYDYRRYLDEYNPRV